jgi:hypothetical protein
MAMSSGQGSLAMKTRLLKHPSDDPVGEAATFAKDVLSDIPFRSA